MIRVKKYFWNFIGIERRLDRMNYTLRNPYQPLNPETCLEEILTLRGVREEDIAAFMHPSKEDENDPHLLENIDEAAEMYLRHLRKNSKICYIVD